MFLIKKERIPFLLRFWWVISIIAFINGQDVDENNKFQEFVQIQRINGTLLCGGVIIDSQFVATAAACLHGHFAERYIKDIGSDGHKIIVSEYKSPNGLGLVRFEPNYSGDALQTAGEEPEIGDRCKLLGWDIDNEGKPYQLANEINFTTNFLDEIRHVQIGNICESMSVKVLICKRRLQHFIVRNCVNGQAEYSEVDVLSHNAWINKIYNCVLHKSGTCKLEEGVDIVNVIPTSTIIDAINEEKAMIEDFTSTTTYSTTTFSTTMPEHFTVIPQKSDQSNSDKIQPIFSIILILFGIIFFI